MSREALNELEKASGAAHRACSPRLALLSLCRAGSFSNLRFTSNIDELQGPH